MEESNGIYKTVCIVLLLLCFTLYTTDLLCVCVHTEISLSSESDRDRE
jgi:hypothetical protein